MERTLSCFWTKTDDIYLRSFVATFLVETASCVCPFGSKFSPLRSLSTETAMLDGFATTFSDLQRFEEDNILLASSVYRKTIELKNNQLNTKLSNYLQNNHSLHLNELLSSNSMHFIIGLQTFHIEQHNWLSDEIP
jgi:hypothetical protein